MLIFPIAWVSLRPFCAEPAQKAEKARFSKAFPLKNLSGKEENNADF